MQELWCEIMISFGVRNCRVYVQSVVESSNGRLWKRAVENGKSRQMNSHLGYLLKEGVSR